MMPWLRGDLSGIEPRTDLPRLRDAASAAAQRGEDLRPLYAALGALDPLACAELAAGSGAIAHPVAVTGALEASEVLETVMSPAGLYGRLIDLAPSLASAILVRVAHRHLLAPWFVRLARRADPQRGMLHLEVALDLGRLDEVAAAHAEAGHVVGLVHFSGRTGSVVPAAALWRAGNKGAALGAARAALDADPSAPIVPMLAALVGPGGRFGQYGAMWPGPPQR